MESIEYNPKNRNGILLAVSVVECNKCKHPCALVVEPALLLSKHRKGYATLQKPAPYSAITHALPRHYATTRN